MKFLTLGSVCFDFKLILEMIFRKSGCLIVTSNLVKLKNISSWLKNIAKTTENDFRFHFHFKWLLALENRRKRERESKSKSKKIADVAPVRQSQERYRERKKRDDCTRSMIAPVWRSHQIDDRTSPTIALDRWSHQSNSNAARSRLCRMISPLPSPIEPSRLSLFLLLSIWPDLMNFFAGFCFFCEWVWN